MLKTNKKETEGITSVIIGIHPRTRISDLPKGNDFCCVVNGQHYNKQ